MTYSALFTRVGVALLTLFLFSVNAYCGNKKDDDRKIDKKEAKRAFIATNPSEAVKETIEWVKDKKDNRKLPYAVIDKTYSDVYVFDRKGNYIASGPVLLGISRLDRIDPKTLKYNLSQISKEKRVTPSGRYLSFIGKDHRGKELLWLDYKYAIALHPVANVPGQNRRTRLKTKTHKDNRITWGCINVEPNLFKGVISPMFKRRGGMVYVLPEEPENKGIMQIVDKR